MTCCRDETSNKRLGSIQWIQWLYLVSVATIHHTDPVVPVPVPCSDILRYQHCREDPDGVRDLDCFWKSSPFQKNFCTWRPGRDPSEKTYTLFIHRLRNMKDDNKCDFYPNITVTFINILMSKGCNFSATVFESGASNICTKAFFRGLLSKQCGPLDNVTFRRLRGRIAMNVSWDQNEIANIEYFAVRYRAQGSHPWVEPPLQSDNAMTGTVGSVNSSLAYSVQVRCVNNSNCERCVWSRVYDVQPELTTAPDLAGLEEADAVPTVGSRRLSLTWKFDSGKNDGYIVTIGKASGEAPRESFHTVEREITFILSYSSYHLEISAFNNVSTSSPLRLTVPRREERLGVGAGKPNVTVHSNRSFTISVRDNVTRQYVCYSAEWMGRGQKAAFMSYYSRKNSRKLDFKNDMGSLEPYRRYTLTLHLRTNKDSCNMRHVNNSESTYGTTQFYFLEGSPAVAPENVSSYVMQDSAVLQWSPITEEDARGFLLGYVIYYSKYQQETRTEKNVTVNPDVNSHTLVGLESRTPYEVQIAGFTRTGVGVRSKARAFTTDKHEYSKISGIVKVTTIVTTVLIFGSPIIKRAKRTLWTSIPNPEKSKTMQKMELTNELELLQCISTLRVEDWETHSLHIVEKGQFDTACVSGETASILEGPEEELGDAQDTHLRAAPPALAGGYTTMEMFRQAVPLSAPASREREPDAPAVRSQQDYVRQGSADSTHDNGVNH